MSALTTELEPAPIEIDPPTCKQCGCVIEDFEALIYLRAAELVEKWERADPRDNWKHTGEAPPPYKVRNSVGVARSKPPYVTPESTKQAFLYVARKDDAAYLAQWLERHPQDVATLTKLWEAKNGHS